MEIPDRWLCRILASDRPRGTVYVGLFDTYLYAVKSDGKLKWKFQMGDSIPSSPAIGTDGTGYVGLM